MSRVLILTGEEAKGLLTMKEAIEAVEEAFRFKGRGRTHMPPKLYLYFEKYEGDLRVMPAYLEEGDIAGVKIVNSHPNNPKRFGLPTVMALMILIDPKNGMPLSVMDGTWLTSMRTGASGGVAASYLARRDSSVIGMVGTGIQARTQLIALKEVLPKIELVKASSLTRRETERYADAMRENLGLNVQPVDTVEEAVVGSDVIVTTTPVTKPIVMNEWIGDGVHINAIGADAPGKEEVDPQVLKRAKIIVDDLEQAVHSGEINIPLSKGIIDEDDIYTELGEIVAGKKPGRTNDDELTVFDSTGLAIQDVATAWKVYEKAKTEKVGTWMEFF